MSTAVLDASAAVSIALGGVRAADFGAFVTRLDCRILAADHYVAEVTNALWKYLRAGQLSAAAAVDATRKCVSMVDELAPSSQLFEEALLLAAQHDHPAYDAFYVVLARRHAATLLTLDRRLQRLAETCGVAIA